MADFDRETAVERVGEHTYRGELREGWRIGEVPNGGYVLAVAARALLAEMPHPDPLTVSAYYLAPTALGPVECRVEVLRRGGGTSFGEVALYQDGELRVKVTAACTDLAKLRGESWSAAPRPEIPPWDACPPLPQKGVEFRQRAEMRLVSGGEVFSERRADGRGEFSGWVRHRDGADPDALALLMFADSLPPPVMSLYGPVGWVPTVELTVQVRAHPAPGPLQARLRSRHLSRGVVEADGEYWDAAGELVALSRQTAKFRRPA